MSQTKAQLIQPIGVVTASGVVVSGVMTAATFDGDIVGSATSIIQGKNLNVGAFNATSFAGDFTGNATGIITSSDIKVGQLTASSFVGDFTGTATSMFKGTGFTAGTINSQGFVADVTGNVAGDVTGNISGNITGNVTGDASGHAGGLGVNYNGGWTGAGTSQISVGVITATSYYGDGSNLDGVSSGPVSQQAIGTTYEIDVTSPAGGNYTLSGTDRNGTVSGSDPTVTVEVGDTLNFVVDASGHPFYIRVSDGGANVSTPAATNQGAQSGTVSWTPNTAGTYYYQCGNHAGMLGTITVSATTTVDLSLGNVIYYTQTNDTTVSFANTANGNVYFIRTKDDNTTARTITWPDRIKWDGGTAPTLLDNPRSTDAQVFLLVTRDMGVTWYGKEVVNVDPQTFTMFTWGGNNHGQLGLNDEEQANKKSSPVQVGTNTNWKYGQFGYAKGNMLFASATKTDGTLWSWGYGANGNLGHNDRNSRSSPTQVPGTTWNRSTGVGENNMLSTKTDGTLWAWGSNSYSGPLGLNHRDDVSSPTQVPGTWGTSELSICGYNYFTAGVKANGTLWAWGNNNDGQLGQNNRTKYSSPVQVGTDTDWLKLQHSGSYGMGCIKTDGTYWVWGKNQHGNLGQNSTNPGYSSPVQVGTDTNWSQATSTSQGRLAIKTNGTLWAWGQNEKGQMGQNNTTIYSSPRQVGTDATWSTVVGADQLCYGTKTDGTAWSWGFNDGGALGQNSSNNQELSSPTQIPGTSWEIIYAVQNMGMGFQKAG